MNPRSTVTLCLGLLISATIPTRMVAEPKSTSTPRPNYGSVERLDPALDAVLAPGAVMEDLAEGFTWSEGPTWLKRERALVFSDVPANKIYRWSERDGVTVFLNPSGYTGSAIEWQEPGSNGLTTDRAGRLVLCQHGDRRISRLTRRNGTAGTFEPLISTVEGRLFNSPNDLVFARNGDLYFTDPPYAHKGVNQSPLKELAYNGVFLRRASGEVVLLEAQMTFPNGIALSPDETILYVTQSDPKQPVVRAYDIKSDGTLEHGRVLFNALPLVRADRPGMPDGMKVDASGNLWATGPGGVLILSPGGRHLGSLLTGNPTGNCAWGGDGSTLYITANHHLLRIATRTRGSAF